eukprot:5680158-Prymnesium_polylepis.1
MQISMTAVFNNTPRSVMPAIPCCRALSFACVGNPGSIWENDRSLLSYCAPPVARPREACPVRVPRPFDPRNDTHTSRRSPENHFAQALFRDAGLPEPAGITKRIGGRTDRHQYRRTYRP